MAMESVLLLLVVLLVATALILVTVASLHGVVENRLDRAAMKSGAEPTSDAGLPMDRVRPLLQPLDFTKTDRIYQFGVGGYEAFVMQWRVLVPLQPTQRHILVALESPVADVWAGVWHAYLVLGCGGPHLRVYPKALFGKPAGCVRVPRDRAFARRFHVQAQDADTARWYLGPALRRFLLTLPAAWSFHAEPTGVGLVAEGELPRSEAGKMRKVLERPLAAAEPTRMP